MNWSRRRALRLIGTAGFATATAGCLSMGTDSGYTLVGEQIDTSSIGRPYFRSDPVAIEATTRVDLDTETKAQSLATLLDTGRVTVRQWPLVGRDDWGKETRPRPTFFEREGTYYEVQVADERYVDQERWHFAFERTDGNPPDDATVVSDPVGGLSDQDTQIVQAALDAVYAGHDGFLGEPEFDGLQTVEFHRDLSVAESDLVPSPPFDFVESEDETFRAVTEQRTVAVPEWTYEIEAVADSREAFDAYGGEAIQETELVTSDLTEPALDVLDTAVSETDNDRYEEEPPLSDGLSAVLDALGIAGALQSIDSYDERVAFRNVVAAYEGTTYRFDLLVMP